MARKVKLTEGELMAALLAEYELPPLLDDDITAKRMAEQGSGQSVEFWRSVLNRRSDLIKVKCYNPVTKRPATAYRPKDDGAKG